VREVILDKHWWLGLSSICLGAVISMRPDLSSSSSWFVNEWPIYALFFFGAFWTSLLAARRPILSGLSHLISVFIVVVAVNRTLGGGEFSGSHGLELACLIGAGVSFATVVPGVVLGAVIRRLWA